MSTEYELDPEEASQPPLALELSARFPDWPAEQIEELMRDHEDEISLLSKWVEAGLPSMMREVKELVRRDADTAGASDDIAM